MATQLFVCFISKTIRGTLALWGQLLCPRVQWYVFLTGCPTKHAQLGFLIFLIFLIVKDKNCGLFEKPVKFCVEKCRNPFLYLKKGPVLQWFFVAISGMKIWAISSSSNTITDKEISYVLLRMFNQSDKSKLPLSNTRKSNLRSLKKFSLSRCASQCNK